MIANGLRNPESVSTDRLHRPWIVDPQATRSPKCTRSRTLLASGVLVAYEITSGLRLGYPCAPAILKLTAATKRALSSQLVFSD